MSNVINGNVVGSYSHLGKTFILVDENGVELTGVVTDNIQIFDATPEDVNAGKVFASDGGISTGIKEIPAYTYAIIDSTGMCNEVRSTSVNCDAQTGFITISAYDTDYIGKYYNNNKWYLDNTFVTEWH